jgi:hypothetical protein
MRPKVRSGIFQVIDETKVRTMKVQLLKHKLQQKDYAVPWTSVNCLQSFPLEKKIRYTARHVPRLYFTSKTKTKNLKVGWKAISQYV